MKTKKGLMQSWTGKMILLAVMTAVILLVFGAVFMNYQSNIKKDTCRLSVETRSTFNAGPLNVGQRFAPLRCETAKICLTTSPSKTCEEQFMPSSKDNLVRIVELSDDPKIAKQQITETYANALYNCNYMMGEGKKNFLPPGFLEYTYCAICARIALDKSVKNPAPEGINYFDVYWFMQNTKDLQGVSYLESVFHKKTAQEIQDDLLKTIAELNLKGKIENGEIEELKNQGIQSLDLNMSHWVFNASEEQAIMVKAITKGKWASSLGGGAGVIGGVFFIGGVVLSYTGIGAIVGIPMIAIAAAVGGGSAVAVVGGAVYVTSFPDGLGQYFTPQIYPYKKDSLGGQGCQSFENLP